MSYSVTVSESSGITTSPSALASSSSCLSISAFLAADIVNIPIPVIASIIAAIGFNQQFNAYLQYPPTPYAATPKRPM